MARPKIGLPRRREVYLVGLDPTLGAEIKKTRPALVLQNDIANRWSPITIVAAITSRIGERLYPTQVRIQPPEGGLDRDSVVLLNQLRSTDKQRLLKRLDRTRSETMRSTGRSRSVWD